MPHNATQGEPVPDPHEAWNQRDYRGLLWIVVVLMAAVFVLNMLASFR